MAAQVQASEIRKDPVLERWVIIAPHRGRRLKFVQEEPQAGPATCPFCPGNEGMTPPEIMAYREPGTKPNTAGWRLRVVHNKFPALQIEGDLDRTPEGMYDLMNGIGAHEVIIESPNHDPSAEAITIERMDDTLRAYRDRVLDLGGDKRMRCVLVFKNHGARAGASLMHPHSQLIATPIVPKRVVEELEGAERHYRFKERCVFCDVLREELRTRERMVAENDVAVGFAPYAARFPFEACVMPKQHRAAFERIEDHEIRGVAEVLLEVLRRMSKSLDSPPYNYMLHSAPYGSSDVPHYHWHFEIVPRITEVQGFEWGTGFFINPTSPEEAARYMREVAT
jgi:UDPglucose--hexose-1-phosphate uridylyltransferase